jgi:glycosyltransferase involved in cell wall biosynthesis
LNTSKRSKSISILIPALNEQDGITRTISSIPKKKLADQGYDLEIIVIDGISTDRTVEIARAMDAKVIFEKRRGYGRAYKTGFCEAKGDIIVTLDGDGTYPAELIPDYIQHFNEKKLDFITVNRFSKMEDNAMLFSHKIGNRMLSFVMFLLYSVKIKDSQSGMWIMSKRFTDTINLLSDDFSLSEEIKIIAFRFFKAIELEGQYYRRAGKQKLLTFKDGWNNLKYLFTYKSLLNSSIKLHPGLLENENA